MGNLTQHRQSSEKQFFWFCFVLFYFFQTMTEYSLVSIKQAEITCLIIRYGYISLFFWHNFDRTQSGTMLVNKYSQMISQNLNKLVDCGDSFKKIKSCVYGT